MRQLGCFVNDILNVASYEPHTKQLTQLIVNAITTDRDASIKALRIAEDYTESGNRERFDFGLMVIEAIWQNNPYLRKHAQAAKDHAANHPPGPTFWNPRFLAHLKRIVGHFRFLWH